MLLLEALRLTQVSDEAAPHVAIVYLPRTSPSQR